MTRQNVESREAQPGPQLGALGVQVRGVRNYLALYV
jgi:hypothetical protein